MINDNLKTRDYKALIGLNDKTFEGIKLSKNKTGVWMARLPGFEYAYTLKQLGCSDSVASEANKLDEKHLAMEFTQHFYQAKDSVLGLAEKPKEYEIAKGTSGQVVIPKGYFASCLPPQVVKYLVDAKRARQNELSKKLEALNLAAGEMHKLQEDKYAGDFGLWLKTLFIFAKSNDNGVRAKVLELTQQTFGVMRKGRSFVLPSLKKAYGDTLVALQPIKPQAMVSGQGLVKSFADVLKEGAKPHLARAQENASTFKSNTKDKLVEIKETTTKNGGKFWGKIRDLKAKIVKKSKSLWSRINPQNEMDGTEKVELEPTIAEPFIVLKRLVQITLIDPLQSGVKKIWSWLTE
jgi:hypothetical protein